MQILADHGAKAALTNNNHRSARIVALMMQTSGFPGAKVALTNNNHRSARISMGVETWQISLDFVTIVMKRNNRRPNNKGARITAVTTLNVIVDFVNPAKYSMTMVNWLKILKKTCGTGNNKFLQISIFHSRIL